MDRLKPIIFDIETNGLNGDRIWVFAWHDMRTGNSGHITDKAVIRSYLKANSHRTLCGHYITGFDIPALERILDIKIENPLIDTLPISQYIFYRRNSHGLEDWGEDFNIPKPKIIDWDNEELLDEYINRCNEDVKINTALYKKEINYMAQLYNRNIDDIVRVVEYLTWKYDCIREQEENPMLLDVKLVEKTISELENISENNNKILSNVMPKNIIYRDYNMPKVMYKKDGTLSSHGKKWLDYLNQENLDVDTKSCKKLLRIEDANPNSSKQRKDWLFQNGWQPITFKINDKKERVPQIKKDDKLCPSVIKLMGKLPEIKYLEKQGIYSHRLGLLKGFLKNKNPDDNYIKASVFGLTNTMRFKHRNLVNLPGTDKPYGEEIRGSLRVPDGCLLVGSDMSSLETNTKLHYMYPFDPDYVDKILNEKGYDAHLDIALAANMISQEDVDWYKLQKYNKEELKIPIPKESLDRYHTIHKIRHQAKQGNYASTYNVGPKTLANTIGSTIKVAKSVIDGFWKLNWSIKAYEKTIKTKRIGKQLWAYSPISKMWLFVKQEKDLFSLVNQNTGAYCFDLYVKEVRKKYKISMQFHDEVAFKIIDSSDSVNEMKLYLQNCIDKVNNIVKLNVPLGISIDIGVTYASVH